MIVGIVNEIEGFIEKYDAKYGNFNVVLTGGNSAYFASQLKYKIFALDYALTDIGDRSIALYSNIFSLKIDINPKTK